MLRVKLPMTLANVNELTDQEDIRSQLHPGKAENLTNYRVFYLSN
jgi:hypothetical protein